MTYKIEDFCPVEGEPNQWLHSTDGLFVGREGQTLESVVAEANMPFVPAAIIPAVISSRQFFLQLALSGLTDQVSAWVAQQDPLVPIAFNKSATFRRDDEMLQQGFAGLGFTVEQVDAFFTAASAL
jgi:hypothetical protein